MEYNYEQLKGLSPKEFSNFWYNNLKDSSVNNIIRKFIDDFLSESDDNIFLMGNNVQTPNSTVFIEVIIQDTKVYWRQVICGNDYVSLPNGSNNWYIMTLDELKSALFFGMTRNNANAPGELRRCNKYEIEKSDMLDYIKNADETEDGIYELNKNESKSEMNECGMSTVSALETTVGVGNVTPPKSVAFTGAEQSGTDCIGSGDLLGGSSKNTKKYGVYKKRGNKRIRLNKNLSYANAVKQANLLNEKNNTNEYKIYQTAD